MPGSLTVIGDSRNLSRERDTRIPSNEGAKNICKGAMGSRSKFDNFLQACALYNNWWPMLSALMYVLVPMPCLFFGGGSTQFLISRDGGG
ncbi:hypothetical protein RHMOL_Rhmol04G0218500 [Rhododendron molle]|uniref:Uncharacterized protein n=1 Tax=Rhododendron molle TaxID=49168 RepID=A0ACC0P5G2_RHOML|nr:hypothetical protein RHMOL_Rhmol04G0218500 [Rhododendron molle]